VISYRVALTASAEKELMPRLENLATTPRPSGCKKLRGGDNEWRIRIGDYRIVYVIDDNAKTIDVTRIAHRREVYQ
jgi:mRNA interferase RelE/StbE